jgi:hypothetical protein
MYRGAPNNGMHPTACTPALIFGNRAGRRVMPGVRFLLVDRRWLRTYEDYNP